ncbi:fluoride efflux transporter CrcB [Ornithinibacillus californiensis]|uniref:fluoride efflux transporter CrcB n=1 Tax=Ornithinibacillus californiensis TaxID=161536 RepID=UPI00064DE90A|nr:fluoride efflux transporter CrcB [Ornithinibacillus californiensis]
MNILLISLGGFLGSILRFYISIKLDKRLVGTWLANVTGSMLLGVSIYFHSIHMISDYLWLFLGIGFCGSYTTFSTFGNEVVQLLLMKDYRTATLYIVTSLFVSILVVLTVFVLLGYKF